jgi:hypothetical protein
MSMYRLMKVRLTIPLYSGLSMCCVTGYWMPRLFTHSLYTPTLLYSIGVETALTTTRLQLVRSISQRGYIHQRCHATHRLLLIMVRDIPRWGKSLGTVFTSNIPTSTVIRFIPSACKARMQTETETAGGLNNILCRAGDRC